MCLKSQLKQQSTTLEPCLLNKNTFDVRSEFYDVFQLLLSARELTEKRDCAASREDEDLLSKNIDVLIRSNIDKLYELPRASQYTRHIIGTENEWVGYICRWEKQAVSSIHGHPSFVFYQVLEGEIQMDLYKPVANNVVEHDRSISMTRGDTIWREGEEACYDNLVHRVSTPESPGFTIHLFSEDPARGRHYSVA